MLKSVQIVFLKDISGIFIISHIRQTECLQDLASFHPEIALFRNLCVNLRNHLCGVPLVRLRVIP